MTKYVALLRGINVGGNNMIKMPELKQAFISIGMQDVSTYIQSGNVLFSSDKGEEELKPRLENTIQKSFGLDIPVILRSIPQLEKIKAGMPFSEEEISEMENSAEGEALYLFLFAQNPSLKDIERILVYKGGSDRFEIRGRDMYVLFDKTIRNSKLAGVLQRTEVSVTSRNIKTVNKLIELGTSNI
ncbi:DUF1697 domain-containing protein [Dysgonomonas sp.]